MSRACLLLIVVLLFAIPSCFSECFLEIVKSVPQYQCNSLQDLEEQGDSNVFDVVVNKPSDPSSKKLAIKIILAENSASAEISSNTFKLLNDLTNLFKTNRNVGTLSAGIFINLPVQELRLQNNGITNIEKGAFSTLRGLEVLYITDNKLSVIKSGIYNNLQVETLAFSRNRISIIEKNALTHLPRLTRLHLDGNRISEFQPDIIMNYPGKLEELWLQNNYLTDIDHNTVRGLSNLKHLNMNINKISRCASYTFDEAPNIEFLALGDNLLEDLKAEVFPSNGMQKLRKLYLHNNRLSFLTTRTLEKLRNLEGIRIGGNPWQCPCLNAVVTWLGDHNIQQNCDKMDYFNGTRPVCVVSDVHTNRCIYEQDGSYYQKYTEAVEKYPAVEDCVL